MDRYYSHAGYAGALTIILTASALLLLKTHHYISAITYDHIFGMVAVVFVVMLISEYFFQKRFRRSNAIVSEPDSTYRRSNLYLIKSTFFRFLALFIPFLFFYAIIENHDYFTGSYAFSPTRYFFDKLLYLFAILGIPYIFMTLKLRGGAKYEIGDYAILTIVGIKSLARYLQAKLFKKSAVKQRLWRNRRVKKVLLLYLVNFFFLTLMARFLVQEFHGFENAWLKIASDNFETFGWYQQYKTGFQLLFHLLFTIDVAIAVIGYSIASRWLYNRTRSVDATLSGWMVALICYPPFNSITTQFFGYSGLDTHNLFSNEYILALILTIVIVLYMIYVWATVALGFKFSNLTHRGIVERGPYAIVRHPAYIAKNSAWWLDNTYVLTNIWATVALAVWNIIYILRGLTEERHLGKDRAYGDYCEKVKYRFIPGVI